MGDQYRVLLLLLFFFFATMMWGYVLNKRLQGKRVQFSLRELLIVSTFIAFTLGVMIAVIRHAGQVNSP